ARGSCGGDAGGGNNDTDRASPSPLVETRSGLLRSQQLAASIRRTDSCIPSRCAKEEEGEHVLAPPETPKQQQLSEPASEPTAAPAPSSLVQLSKRHLAAATAIVKPGGKGDTDAAIRAVGEEPGEREDVKQPAAACSAGRGSPVPPADGAVVLTEEEGKLMRLVDQEPEEYALLDESKLEHIKYYVDRNVALLKTRDGRGFTPLHLACYRGRVDVVSLLLSYKKHMEVDAATPEGITPLMLACGKGCLEAIEMLLEAGANMECETKEGWRAAHFASFSGHVETAIVLLRKRGANLSARTRGELCGIPAGSTPHEIFRKVDGHVGSGPAIPAVRALAAGN
ncbi:hypothetical protein Agub_g15083, partial [Astrephomene gubernaculifera]